MTIALLCPTRDRPDQCQRMIKSAQTTGLDDISKRVYLALSLEDYDIYETTANDLITPDGMPTVHKWNLLAQQALKDQSCKLFMLAADDIVFSTPCWDKALLDHYNALHNKIHVYAFRDSRDPDGTPHPIVSREYIEAMGYFFPPIFLHWFVDSWTVDIAKSNGVFTHLKDYMLEHRKPSDTGNPDETHTRIRAMGWHERDKFVNEHCQHYLALEKSRLKMRMCA